MIAHQEDPHLQDLFFFQGLKFVYRKEHKNLVALKTQATQFKRGHTLNVGDRNPAKRVDVRKKISEAKFGKLRPDIAGKNIANPLASILSFSMALRYSFDMDKDADMLDQAVKNVLKDGYRTQDIMEKGQKKVSTSEMGDLVISKLK